MDYSDRTPDLRVPWRAALREAVAVLARNLVQPRRGLQAPTTPSAPLLRPPAGALRATWAGHASTVLQLGGKTVLLDPVWSPRLSGLFPRLQPPGVAWEHLGRVDAVLVSHNHYDHMDAATLKRLPRDTAVVVPRGLGAWFRRHGFTTVHELEWWQSVALDGLQVTLVPAHHWSRRGVHDTNRTLWGGFVVQAEGVSAYYAGDTADGPCFATIGARFRLDLAILPIGAYAPRSVNGNVHVDPEQAARAFVQLGARELLPVHWGTFRLGAEPACEPIERLEAAWSAMGLERGRLRDLPVGGQVTLRPVQEEAPLAAA